MPFSTSDGEVDTTIYPARIIHTMNPSRPEATHVAVRDGHVLGVGSLAELTGWGKHTIDKRFADKVLLPGFIEGHCHLVEGAFWRFTYCGFHDRSDANGRTWPGLRSLDAVVERLIEAKNLAGKGLAGKALAGTDPAGAPVTGWGLDPIFFDDRRCTRADLDRVSASRPVGVMNASGHILHVNTLALRLAGLLRKGVDHPGIPLGKDGLPTGELRSPDAFTVALPYVGLHPELFTGDEAATREFARLAVRAGVTTATDLANSMSEAGTEVLERITSEADYPLRVVPFLRLVDSGAARAIKQLVALRSRSTDRLRLGRMKLVADGSIQGFSARLRWPGYYNGAPPGLWYSAPETLRTAYELALQHGVPVHTHTNGDQATELALDCIEQALCNYPRPDHRFTLQHCQLADRAQFRRMKKLGLCVNLFANHHFYWGDQHYALTVGPERAERMNACASARDCGVPFAIHSDAPITPLAPLFTAWCAVNRLTSSGRCLGEAERISIADALYAITMGAAYTLHLDSEVGSIEVGKRADFAVLEDDPYQTAPEALKDVRVWGTVQGGRVFAAASI